MSRCARGDVAALGEVYDLAARPLYEFLLRLSRDHSLAEDLTHDTFVRMHTARALYRIGAPVMPWAYTIARRLFLETLRTRRMEARRLGARVDVEDALAEVAPASGAEQPDEVASARQLSQQVERILRRIPEAQATAFVLLKQQELSVTEAASVLGTTEMSVKLRAHRAYEALRATLDESWGRLASAGADSRESRVRGGALA